MSFLDKAKDLAGKAEELAKDHPDQLDAGIDKAGNLVDKVTGGRFDDQIDSLTGKAHESVHKLDDSAPTPPSDPGA